MDTTVLVALISDEMRRIADAEGEPPRQYPVDESNLAAYCDHTVLKAYTPRRVIEAFCEEAIENGAASVCVNPIHIPLVSARLAGTGLKTCCVVGFPLGANTPRIKAMEAAEAVLSGAQELDMVINVGALIDGDYALVYEDVKGVVEAASGRAKVKVILETCYLSHEEKIAACVIAKAAGADYVKTSSGFGTWGATVEDVRLMKRVVGEELLVKASTGIETRDDAIAMIRAGAARLGTSRTVQIRTGDNGAFSASKLNPPRKPDAR